LRLPVPLHLDRHLPVRDVRRLIWAKLAPVDLEMIRCAHNSRREPKLNEADRAQVIQRGHLAFIQWCWKQGQIEYYSALRVAARAGHVHVLEWLHDMHVVITWNVKECQEAAKGGHLAAMQYLRKVGTPWDTYTTAYATMSGSVELMQWMLTNGAPDVGRGLFVEYACRGHQLPMVQWLCANNYANAFEIPHFAAIYGHLDILCWAWAQPGVDAPTPWLHVSAARGGQLHISQFLLANNCPWDQEFALAAAAITGHLEYFKWAHAHGAQWTAGQSDAVARNMEQIQRRHPAMLAHLRESGLIAL